MIKRAIIWVLEGCGIMKIVINRRKIPMQVLTKKWERFKGYMWKLDPITLGLCYPKKRYFSTYFYCQSIDLVMTDKNYKILYLYKRLRSEKRIFFKRKVYYTFVLPADSCQDLKVGDTLNVLEK